MTQAALRAFRDEPGSRFGGATGGEAEAGQTNVVRAFAQPVNSRQIYNICEIRQQRGKFLPHKLFGEPAWDILLELYAAELDQQRMSITRLTRRSKIPATTVLRFLTTLSGEGLIVRKSDPTDARRVFVSLTPDGIESMNRFFTTCGSRAEIL